MANLTLAQRNHPARKVMDLEKAATGPSLGIKLTTGSLPR
jgi:hypothetical protein